MKRKKLKVVLSGYSAADGSSDIVLAALSETGALVPLDSCRLGTNPSCLCVGENGLLYAGSELDTDAFVTAFDFSGDMLRLVAEYHTPGAGLCHLLSSKRGIFGCCYVSGSVFLLSGTGEILWKTDGGSDARAHWSSHDGDGALCWADFGRDALLRVPLKNGIPYGRETHLALPRATGPRQLLMLDNGETAVVNELSGNISFLNVQGGTNRIQTVSTTAARKENYPGGACIMQDGTLLVANRGADTIAALKKGEYGWTFVEEWSAVGRWPRWLCPQESRLLSCCQHSGVIYSYYWDGKELHPCDALTLSGASCVVILPDRQSG